MEEKAKAREGGRKWNISKEDILGGWHDHTVYGFYR